MDITENWSIYVGGDELTKYHQHNKQNHAMRPRTIQIDDEKSIIFTGEQLGYTTWQLREATEFTLETHLYASLYRTEGGKFICELDIDQLDIENTVTTAAICSNDNEIVEFYGLDYRFRLFYRQLNLDKLAYEIHVA